MEKNLTSHQGFRGTPNLTTSNSQTNPWCFNNETPMFCLRVWMEGEERTLGERNIGKN